LKDANIFLVRLP